MVYIVLFIRFSEPADTRRLRHMYCFGLGGMALLIGAISLDLVMGGKATIYSVICCAASCFCSGAPFYNFV